MTKHSATVVGRSDGLVELTLLGPDGTGPQITFDVAVAIDVGKELIRQGEWVRRHTEKPEDAVSEDSAVIDCCRHCFREIVADTGQAQRAWRHRDSGRTACHLADQSTSPKAEPRG